MLESRPRFGALSTSVAVSHEAHANNKVPVTSCQACTMYTGGSTHRHTQRAWRRAGCFLQCKGLFARSVHSLMHLAQPALAESCQQLANPAASVLVGPAPPCMTPASTASIAARAGGLGL